MPVVLGPPFVLLAWFCFAGRIDCPRASPSARIPAPSLGHGHSDAMWPWRGSQTHGEHSIPPEGLSVMGGCARVFGGSHQNPHPLGAHPPLAGRRCPAVPTLSPRCPHAVQAVPAVPALVSPAVPAPHRSLLTPAGVRASRERLDRIPSPWSRARISSRPGRLLQRRQPRCRAVMRAAKVLSPGLC